MTRRPFDSWVESRPCLCNSKMTRRALHVKALPASALPSSGPLPRDQVGPFRPKQNSPVIKLIADPAINRPQGSGRAPCRMETAASVIGMPPASGTVCPSAWFSWSQILASRIRGHALCTLKLQGVSFLLFSEPNFDLKAAARVYFRDLF